MISPRGALLGAIDRTKQGALFGLLELLKRALSRRTRVSLVFIVIGTTIASLLDVLGVLAMVPLMAAMTGDAGAAAAGAGVLSILLPEPSSGSYIVAAAALVAGAFVLKAVFGIVFRWWSLGVLSHEQVRVSSTIMRRHLLAPYAMHRERGYAELTNVLGVVVPQAFRAVGTVLVVLSEALTVLFVAAAIVVIQPVIAVVAFVLLGGIGAAFQIIVRRRQHHLGQESIRLNHLASAAQLQAYGGAQEVKLRDNAEPFVRTYEDANHKSVHANRVITFIGELPKYLFEVLFVIVLAGAAVVLFLAQGSGGGALIALATFGVAGIRILPSAVRLLASIGIVRSSWPGVESLLKELDTLDDLDERTPPPGGVSFNGGIEVNDVSFSYVADQPALQDVNVSVPAGTSVALVGPSGSGKSTLVDLILGLQRPESGTISSAGVDVWASITDWRTSVAVVPQSVFILDASLRRNIVFDVPDEEIDEQLLADVVRRAQLEDLVRRSSEGLDMVVGDRGARLSGGQKQRIGIARALYRRPKVLVLDEATSALDNITERRVTETIEALKNDEITVVMVAHRLSTVRNADQFVVLDHGRVDAIGDFDHVVASSETFAEMVRLASLEQDEDHPPAA